MCQGLEHMAVAEIPGLGAAIVHDPIIALGGGDQARILGGIQKTVAVVRLVIELLLQQVAELGNDGGLALAVAFGQDRPTVGRWLALPGRQATVALTRDSRRVRIDFVEVLEHGRDRSRHVVDIEPVEASAALCLLSDVVRPHPVDESRDIGISPHPGREALEWRFARAVGQVANVAVDRRGIRPIGLYRDD